MQSCELKSTMERISDDVMELITLSMRVWSLRV